MDDFIGETDSIALFGEWEFYPNQYITDSSELSLLQSPEFIEFPIEDLFLAKQKATYRISIAANTIDSNLVLYVPNLQNHLTVFVNGIEQEFMKISEETSFLSSNLTMVALETLNPDREFQEIVISTNIEKNSSTFYRRIPLISTAIHAIDQLYLLTINEILIMGMIALVALNGFAFMILRPQHRTLTLIALFDTAIIMRLLFGSEILISAIATIIPELYISDSFLLAGKIFSLMIGGFIGSLLSKHLFDPKNKIPTYLTTPIPIAYLILAMILPFRLSIYYSIGQFFFTAVYLYTFAIVGWQFIIFWRKHRNLYVVFQVIKTTYIGVIVFIDIILLNKYVNFLIFQYLILFFFCAHIISKLFDNNNSYKEVYLLNENLEKIVLERTQELSEKNKILSELSIRDPLTSIYNRLYFDEIIETTINNFDTNKDIVHLCMFDFDNFKLINDTYGHEAGDEQLTFATKTVLETVLPDTVFARVGGEEFMILYTNADSDSVTKNVEKIRLAFEKQSKKTPQYTTSSFGLVMYRPSYSKKEFLKIADKKLYVAKENGKNNVIF